MELILMKISRKNQINKKGGNKTKKRTTKKYLPISQKQEPAVSDTTKSTKHTYDCYSTRPHSSRIYTYIIQRKQK